MNTPCRAKTVLGVVATLPSAPPSLTVTWPNCHIDRTPSGADPGTTASALVLTEQVLPTVVDAVVAHGTVTGNCALCTVPGWFSATPLRRSVICNAWLTCTLPA